MTFYHYFAETDIFTDARSKQVVQTKLYQRKYSVTSTWPFQSFDWKLSSESKQIQGYRVQKATAKAYYYEYGPDIQPYRAEVIAWFAPDLPFSAGPEGYYGLPGVILEMQFSGAPGKYVMKTIDFSTTDKPMATPAKGFPISKDQMVFPVKYPINERELKAFFKQK
jgi:GLPGLI family protein